MHSRNRRRQGPQRKLSLSPKVRTRPELQAGPSRRWQWAQLISRLPLGMVSPAIILPMVWISNRLPASLSQTFAYDDGGNRLGRTRLAGGFVYPAGTGKRPHAPLMLRGNTLSCDRDSNMTADGTRTLAWDETNRMSQVINGAANHRLCLLPGRQAGALRASGSGRLAQAPRRSIRMPMRRSMRRSMHL